MEVDKSKVMRITVPLTIHELEEIRSGLYFYRETLLKENAETHSIQALQSLDTHLLKKIKDLEKYLKK